MKLYIDFNSGKAFYIQLINQIILGIAMEQLHGGDSLPSMRQMADSIDINTYTINKACTILHQKSFIKLNRRRDAVISIGVDKLRVVGEMKRELSVCLTRGICNDVSRGEAHRLVDGLYDASSKCEAEE